MDKVTKKQSHNTGSLDALERLGNYFVSEIVKSSNLEMCEKAYQDIMTAYKFAVSAVDAIARSHGAEINKLG